MLISQLSLTIKSIAYFNDKKMLYKIWLAVLWLSTRKDVWHPGILSEFLRVTFFKLVQHHDICYVNKQFPTIPTTSATPLPPSSISACLLFNHFMPRNTCAALNEACKQIIELYLIITHDSSPIHDFPNYLPCGGH